MVILIGLRRVELRVLYKMYYRILVLVYVDTVWMKGEKLMVLQVEPETSAERDRRKGQAARLSTGSLSIEREKVRLQRRKSLQGVYR